MRAQTKGAIEHKRAYESLPYATEMDWRDRLVTAGRNTRTDEQAETAQQVNQGEEPFIHVHLPEELRAAVYANRVTISATQGEFVITFAQIPPLRDEEELEEARRTGRVEALAVANIAVSHGFLPIIISVFQQTLDKLHDIKKAERSESEQEMPK